MPTPLPVSRPTELLAHLFASLPTVRKTKVRQWLKFGAVLVNGVETTQFDRVLRPGDVVVVRSEKETKDQQILPGGMKVHFEDDALVVIDKPADLLTIASKAEREKTAYSFLTAYVRRRDDRANDRVWIVHRLDRETSGLMVFAKTLEAKDALQRNWERSSKGYLAVAEGNLHQDSGTLRSHLDESNPFKVFTAPPSARTREAITHFRVVKRRAHHPERTLLELTLQSGRRHQIRVQLTELGFPIVGDRKYAASSDPAKRLALHASSLRFHHPVTHEEMSFRSPLPPVLAKLV
jgi:23S rRNA pseudouridine1911/1915/1917 synthase